MRQPNKRRRQRAAPTQTRITHDIKQQILSGKWDRGMQLPTRAELIERYDTSNVTMQKVMDVLLDDGFVETRGSLGTFVSESPPHLTRYGLVFPESQRHYYGPASLFWTALSEVAAHFPETDACRLVNYYDALRGQDGEDYGRLVDDIRKHRLAGLVFASPPHEFRGTPVLDSPHLSRAIIEPVVDFPSIPTVYPDYNDFLRQALTHFEANGARRIAFLGFTSAPAGVAEILDDELAMRGMTTRQAWQQYPTLMIPEAARNAVCLLLSNADDRPDGILVFDDNLAEQAAMGVLDAGVSVPDEVCLVAHANFPLEMREAVQVTRIGFDTRELLYRCIELLRLQNEGEQVEPQTWLAAKSDSDLPLKPSFSTNAYRKPYNQNTQKGDTTMRRHTQWTMTVILSLVAAVLFGVARADDTWDAGGSDTNWSTADNWGDDAVPNNEVVTFDDTAGTGTTTYVDSGYTNDVNGLYYLNTSGTHTTDLSGAGILSFINDRQLQVGYDVEGSDAVIQGGTLDLGQYANVYVGRSTADGTSADGVLTITSEILSNDIGNEFMIGHNETNGGSAAGTLDLTGASGTFDLNGSEFRVGVGRDTDGAVDFGSGMTTITLNTSTSANHLYIGDTFGRVDSGTTDNYANGYLNIDGGTIDMHLGNFRIGHNESGDVNNLYGSASGTGTEDYFGGAWGFQQLFTAPFLGKNQGPTNDPAGGRHSMYRWHIMDPIRFDADFRCTIQALGWRSEGRYLPLRDDLSSVAYWYQTEPHGPFPGLGSRDELEIV